MPTAKRAPPSSIARLARTLAAGLSRALITTLFDPYRPERHYMRGPGPRWHAKHDGVPAGTAGVLWSTQTRCLELLPPPARA